MLLQISWHNPSPAQAASYNCISHCFYGQYWPGGQNGTFTYLDAAELFCNGSGCYSGGQVGFIENAEWDYDTSGHNGACSDSVSDGDICWIENGYSTKNSGTNSSEYYFWADNRPGTNCIPPFCSGSYNEHYEGQISQNDLGLYGSYNISRINSNTWSVYGPGYTTQSTSNAISPNNIYMGTELASPDQTTSGAYGSYADWTLNEWVNQYGNYVYQGCGNHGAGLVAMNGAPPPYGHYIVSPCKSGSNGGDIQTWCCDSGGPGFIPARAVPSTSGTSARTYSADPGIPAITPHSPLTASASSGPQFGLADVERYYQTNSLPHAIVTGPTTVQDVQFLTSQAASAKLDGEPLGIPDGTLVAVVELHGNFHFTSVLTSGTTDRVFEVFDAHTGNLLMTSVPG